MKSRCLRLTLLALLAFTSARAGVIINFFGGEFLNSDGTAAVPDGSLVLLISDTTGDGFGNLSSGLGLLDLGAFIDGGDDVVLARTTVDSLSFHSSSVQGVLSNAEFFGDWDAGDALALVWFSSLDGDATDLLAGTHYGFFTTSTPQDGSADWVTPAEGSLIDLMFLSIVNEGSYDDSLFRTSQTVSAVPEPATYATIFGGLALALGLYRRRRAR